VASAEFEGNIAPVLRMLLAIDRKVPDYAFTQDSLARRANGETIEQAGRRTYDASVLRTVYESLNATDFVTSVYGDLLGRAPTAAERTQASAAVSAQGRGGFIAQVANTPEFTTRYRNSVYVLMMYMGMLKRSPEQEGFDYWVGVLRGGQSGLGLVQAFLDSVEYRARFLPAQ
jgi:hypothetical protein